MPSSLNKQIGNRIFTQCGNCRCWRGAIPSASSRLRTNSPDPNCIVALATQIGWPQPEGYGARSKLWTR